MNIIELTQDTLGGFVQIYLIYTLNGQYFRGVGGGRGVFVCVFRLRNVFQLVHNYGLNKSGCVSMKENGMTWGCCHVDNLQPYPTMKLTGPMLMQ